MVQEIFVIMTTFKSKQELENFTAELVALLYKWGLKKQDWLLGKYIFLYYAGLFKPQEVTREATIYVNKKKLPWPVGRSGRTIVPPPGTKYFKAFDALQQKFRIFIIISMSDDAIITYEKLYEVLRLEKYKKELQKIDSDFFPKVIKYLEEKKAILQAQESKDSVFASQSVAKTKRQLENTKMILKELYERREGKIIQMALFNSRTNVDLQETDSLLGEEVNFYNSLVDLFKAIQR